MNKKNRNRQDLAPWTWLFLIALGVIELYRLIGIRFTTDDDAMGLIWGYRYDVWDLALDATLRYGRIQQLIYFPLWLFALKLEDSWIYDLLNYGILAAAHVGAVYVAFLYLGGRLAAMFALIYVATMTLVWEYNLFTSYPVATFLSVLSGTLSLVALYFYRRDGSHWLAALSLLLLTFAFLNYEFMPVIFSVLYVACLFQGVSIRDLWAKAGTSASEFRLAAAVLGLLIFYLSTYFVFRVASPHTYPGTEFAGSFRPIAVLRTTIGLSTHSSIYAWLWHPYTFSVTEFLTGKSVTYSTELPARFLTSEKILAHLPKAVLSGVASFLVLRSSSSVRLGTLAGASAIGVLIMFVPNLLIALTDKYQEWYLEAGVRYYAYTTISHFGFALLAASIVIATLQALERHRMAQNAVKFTIIGLLAVGGLYSSYANAVVARSMQANTDRWRAFDLVMKTPKMREVIRGRTVVAPKLWNTYWEVRPRTTYWNEYANLKYGEKIDINSQATSTRAGLVFLDYFNAPECGAIFSILTEIDSQTSAYTARKLHIATTRPLGNSFLTYRAVAGPVRLIALRPILNGAPTATLAREAFNPRSLDISCIPD